MVQSPIPRSDVWVDPRLRVVESAVHGRSFVAGVALRGGETVIELGGELVDTDELRSRLAAATDDPGAPYVDCLAVGANQHLVLPADSTARYANHSCDPTLWLVGAYVLALRADVGAGTELTVDYATFSDAPGFNLTCRCGTDLCRDTITNNDWRRSDLQARYAGHWSSALQARIDANSAFGV